MVAWNRSLPVTYKLNIGIIKIKQQYFKHTNLDVLIDFILKWGFLHPRLFLNLMCS